MKLKKIKKRWIALAVVAVAGVWMYTSFTATASRKPMLTSVSVQTGELRTYLSLSGKVTSGGLDEYILSGGSEVSEVNFKSGDTVKKGDVIIRFDNTTAMDDYKKAAIAYETVRLQLDDTERTYFELKEDIAEVKDDMEWLKKKRDEYESSSHPDDIAMFKSYDQRYESAKAKLESLEKSVMSDEAIKIKQLQYEEAKMTMEAAEKTVSQLPQNIVAKNDGIVETLDAVKYNTVRKGQKVCAIRTSAVTTVDIKVGRYDIGKVSVGQTATVTVSGKDYTGTITHIDPVATSDGYVKAIVTVDAPEGLIPSLDAEIEILTYQNDSTTRVPIEAVKTDRQGDYCYVLTPMEGAKEGELPLYQPVKTYVKVGNSSSAHIEILEGLSPDAQLVLSPPKNIDMIAACNVVSGDALV